VVTTLAGTYGQEGSADGTGATARFYNPDGVAVDGAGNVYVADRNNATIRKVTPAGVVTTLAGTAGQIGSADGTGAAASFWYPEAVAVDGAGNVYVADRNNATIRKVTPAGVVTTLAGSAGQNGSADGTGAAASFSYPSGVAVDGAGNVYVADSDNNTIRKVTAAEVVTTLAGSVGLSGSADGTGAAARFSYPTGVAVDGAGNVYVADYYNDTIRKVTPAGVVTTLAGTAGQYGSADGTGATARFSYPTGVAVDGAGNVYVADSDNNTIRKVTPAGVVTTLAGSSGQQGSADGTGAAASFYNPRGVAVDGSGNVYVADSDNNTIRKVTPAGVVTTLAGSSGQRGSADGAGAAASFYNPTGVAVDGAGNVYVADTDNYTIRRVTPAGVVTTLAGTAGQYGSADGTGATARFSYPSGVAVGAGNVYVADQTIRKVTPAGVVTTIVGAAPSSPLTPSSSIPGPLPAALGAPNGVAVNQITGSLYLTDAYAVLVAFNPLNVSPMTATVAAGAQQTFAASAGAGVYTWSLSTNNSGGSITSTGSYTAGSTGGVTDTIIVTDSMGNAATATVAVLAPLVITSGSGGTVTVLAGGQQALTASGGTGPYTWSLSTNNSGGSITSAGVYTAGPTTGVTDTVKVTDSTGASTTISVLVTSPVPVPAMGLAHVFLTAAMLMMLGLYRKRRTVATSKTPG
jgi:sugar lactone lactonase YvrE